MTDVPVTTSNPDTPSPESIGTRLPTTIPVELGTRFLEHFSEQLYSSPQKAFEELVSNGWDAGADYVDIRIPSNLADPNASLCVLDNGASMDEDGLRKLWHIAFSPKKDKPVQYGRQVIGKFGIGKLATYVLANRLTYICKFADGKIRRVTMNYGDIDKKKEVNNENSERLISELELDVFEVQESELEGALENILDGRTILELIRTRMTRTEESLGEDEFYSHGSVLTREPSDTWTLVILSGLKPAGQNLRVGVLKRMLESALPFGTDMIIKINGFTLNPSKVEYSTKADWRIGPQLEIDSVEIDDSDEVLDGTANVISGNGVVDRKDAQRALTKIAVRSIVDPACVEIEGIGRITGRVRLFEDTVTGGKSDERGASNGFHVNVLGRIVNQKDPSFGEDNLSHAAWARFRMAVRADGLNQFLSTDREKFRETRELKIFRAFLRKVFNKVRIHYDSDPNAGLPNAGDVLLQSLGVVSLNPLRNVVSETLLKQAPLPGLFDETGIIDREQARASWREITAENIKNALNEVKYERLDDEELAKFRLSDSSIVVNKEHPFVAEHSRTKAEKELLRTMAMINVLTDIYALDIGIQPDLLASIREYRDQLLRYQALQRRQSGLYIAKLLLQTQHDSGNSKRLEAVVSDALRYLGFHVLDLAQSGEPEGIASAYPTPTGNAPSSEKPWPPLYSFSFDAKSSKHDTAKTGNIKLDGVVEHRRRHKANYALVIAPGYSEGALAVRCQQQQVTPMTARDLGKLLEYTVEYGAIPLNTLQEVFTKYSPEEVSTWVQQLEERLKGKRVLTLDIFLRALEDLKGKIPDVLPPATIAFVCRERLNAVSVTDKDVTALVSGLSILVPDLIGIEQNGNIVVNASASRVAAAVETQLEKLKNDASFS